MFNDPSRNDILEKSKDLPVWDHLKSRKALGPDLVPPVLLKVDIDWQLLINCTLFTEVDGTEIISDQATVAPIYKEEARNNLANYCPISPLSAFGKLYASYLQLKLANWTRTT